MADPSDDARDARAAIRAMLSEAKPPTQKEIAAATGISQGYVSKIVSCRFKRLNDSIRKVVEYSKLSPEARAAAAVSQMRVAARLRAGFERIAARNPALGEALADFVEKLDRHGLR